MPKIVTRSSRIAECETRAKGLAEAVAIAVAAESDPSNSDADKLALWEAAEQHAAKIHRNSRLLAGKSKGG